MTYNQNLDKSKTKSILNKYGKKHSNTSVDLIEMNNQQKNVDNSTPENTNLNNT